MSASSSIKAMRFIGAACASRAAGGTSLAFMTGAFMSVRSPSWFHPLRFRFPPPDSPIRLAEPSGDVVLRDLLPRVGEDLLGLVVLDQPAQHEERGRLRHSGRLLHVVGDDHDRVI